MKDNVASVSDCYFRIVTFTIVMTCLKVILIIQNKRMSAFTCDAQLFSLVRTHTFFSCFDTCYYVETRVLILVFSA